MGDNSLKQVNTESVPFWPLSYAVISAILPSFLIAGGLHWVSSDRVQAEDHRPWGILGEVWWGALSREGRKLDRCSKVIIGFQSLSQAL